MVKCKNCHEEPYRGNLYMRWKKSGHAKADTLASEQSADTAKKLGTYDP